MIAIVNYGVGNTLSLINFFKQFDPDVRLTTSPMLVQAADLVVLPGVGHFDQAMSTLRSFDLEKCLKTRKKANKPILGICLAMHIMFDTSEESPDVSGLGWYRGASQVPTSHNHQTPYGVEHPDHTLVYR